MIATIEGSTVETRSDVILSIQSQLYPDRDFGCNLDSLSDILRHDVARPVTIIWKDSYVSFNKLGAEDFGLVCGVLGRVATEERNPDDFVVRLQ